MQIIGDDITDASNVRYQPIRWNSIYLRAPNFMFYVSTLSNKVN